MRTTRSEALVNSVPQSVSIVRRDQIAEQLAVGGGLGDILGRLVPFPCRTSGRCERDRFAAGSATPYQNPIEASTLLDCVSHYKLSDKGLLNVGITNLLNKQYHNVFAQTVVTPGVYGNTAYAASPGATLHVSYKHSW